MRRGTGFVPPPPGTPMCQYLVVYGIDGRLLDAPRKCKFGSRPDSKYCRTHELVVARLPAIDVHHGGFCVWCGEPAMSYTCDRVTIALCKRHSRALARAIREGR